MSGPHEDSCNPGHQITTAPARYFLVLTVKFMPEKTVIPKDGSRPKIPWTKPLLYAALLERKGQAPQQIMKLLAQVRCEHKAFPSHIIYRVHSDKGSEFWNETMGKYMSFHGIHHTTTQGYDPSSNGAAESAVGLLKTRTRFLLSTCQLYESPARKPG